MPHDPVRAADARAWLEKATLDLRSAEVDLAARPAIVGDALFHWNFLAHHSRHSRVQADCIPGWHLAFY